MGFGAAVIQRLCKTSVKQNLYWEVKDKVIEEAFNGIRMEKQSKKVKVYGLDSTKAIRARLIEILMERVRYHKDKFVSNILYDEMKSMQVKKNGKVEHSDKTHDDQVFSYLMALYVWYDGKNLAENFRIRKTAIKTDADETLEELDIEDALEKREKIDFNSSTFEVDEELAEDLRWVEADSINFKTSNDMAEDEYQELLGLRNAIISSHPELGKQIEEQYGVNLIQNANTSTGFTSLPSGLYNMDDDFDEYGNEITQNMSESKSPLAGNLAGFYDFV